MAAPARPAALSRTTLAALVAGVVLLGLVVAFAVGLPRVAAEEGGGEEQLASLPDRLPGGFVDLREVGGPEGGDAAAIDYVNTVLDDVYPDEDTAFRAYVDEADEALVTVTAFAAGGGAFAPPNGVADPAQLGLDRAPSELVREGEAVCVVSYQSGAPGATGEEDPEPVAVSCQQPHEGTTVQIGAQGIGVDETVALLQTLVDSLEA